LSGQRQKWQKKCFGNTLYLVQFAEFTDSTVMKLAAMIAGVSVTDKLVKKFQEAKIYVIPRS
jgi:hypothetical protein